MPNCAAGDGSPLDLIFPYLSLGLFFSLGFSSLGSVLRGVRSCVALRLVFPGFHLWTLTRPQEPGRACQRSGRKGPRHPGGNRSTSPFTLPFHAIAAGEQKLRQRRVDSRGPHRGKGGTTKQERSRDPSAIANQGSQRNSAAGPSATGTSAKTNKPKAATTQLTLLQQSKHTFSGRSSTATNAIVACEGGKCKMAGSGPILPSFPPQYLFSLPISPFLPSLYIPSRCTATPPRPPGKILPLPQKDLSQFSLIVSAIRPILSIRNREGTAAMPFLPLS